MLHTRRQSGATLPPEIGKMFLGMVRNALTDQENALVFHNQIHNNKIHDCVNARKARDFEDETRKS